MKDDSSNCQKFCSANYNSPLLYPQGTGNCNYCSEGENLFYAKGEALNPLERHSHTDLKSFLFMVIIFRYLYSGK